MRPIQSYFLLILVIWGFSANAQQTASAIPLSFPDSIRIVLENTKNVEATVIGTAFSTAWNSLGVDHQMMIQKQVRMMKQKKIPLRSSIINYLGAISNAVSIENADASKLSGFLNVAQKAIEKENGARLAQFFKSSRTFFQFHALYYDRKYRLYARDDNYSFDYIEPAAGFDLSAPAGDPAAETESEAVNEPPPAEEPAPSGEESPPQDFYAEAPLWMNPPPPPLIEGPVIRFDKVTLNFVTAYDSVFLRDARGTLSLRDYTFVGEQGKFDFTSAGIPADIVDCDIAVFTLKANLPAFKSDLTKLNYREKTPGYIPGILEFKSVPRKDSVASTYPRFKSFQSSLEVKAVDDPNVRYTGGFSLTGNKITGASVGGENSRIEISSNSEKKFVALSREFLFTESTIISNKARVAMYFGADSITHPAVRFRYAFEGDSTQKLSIRKDKGGMKHTPYFSSFFNVDFAADVIRWNLHADSLTIQIDGGRNTVPMVIESVDYYDREDYRLLKGEGFSFHPVALVATYCLQNKVREFYTGDLVVASGKEGRDIKAAIEFLAEKGLVDYNIKTDKVIVKEKAIVLYRGARGEVDYDNLKILSVTDSFPNATVNYSKGQMTVRGVDEFKVSDSLNVRIQPDSSTIMLLRDRDIKFDGTINAGNFEISGKGFTLKYDSFYIRLTHIDSINFYVTEKNARGQSIRRKINNSMVNADATTDSLSASIGGLGGPGKSSGILYISKGNNKSGMKKAGSFPRLDASSGGKIYFDRHEVLDGAYDKSVFFTVPPFKLDSLNDADPGSINFEGSFSSSGMFPTFDEKLHTQPDKSLGFTHSVPASGYKLYQGDGKYNGDLSLDNRGIRGNGSIQFLAATVNSPDFTFYPDSVTARGELANIEQKQFGSELFPNAKLVNYKMKWLPKEDKMLLKNTNAPFEFYNSTAQMRGTITVSKEGVAGAGRFESRGTELVSKNMKFSGTDFSARRARFKVKSEDPNKPLLTGTDVRMVFNLEKNYADISPEVSGDAAIDFPFAQFKTSIPNMRWDVNAQKITMSKDPGQPLAESYFYTTREDLDSLNFNADRAVYDLTSQTLKVSGIPYIIVADAKITPENNEVTILENAKIGTLTNTTIVLDTLNAYHRLTQGVVDIKSRKEFSGYATYQYINFLQDTFAIKMTDFHLEPISEVEVSRKAARKNAGNATMQTVGVGSLLEHDAVVLGAGMFYKGDLTMYATRPALELKGFVKLDITKIKDYNTWIHYEQTGDETEVMIDYDKAITEEGDKVNAGLHFNSTDNNLYITFMSKKHSEDDEDLFVPGGKLYYDTATHEFKIEDLEKAKGTKLSGKVFAYNDDNMQVRFEGPVKLVRGGKGFDISSSALGQGSVETNEIRMNSFLLLDTEIPTPALDVMALQIQDVIKNEGADEGLGDPTELLYKIADIAGEKAVRDYEQRSQQGYVSLATIPQLLKSIALSNVQLKWSQKHKAFYNEGKIGISHILKHDINGAFEGFLEIRKTEDGGTVFHLFFKASPEAWYYFGFEDNRLMVQSSNGEVNGVISKKANAKNAKPGEVVFIPGSDEETLAFINRFRKDYYSIDYGYDLGEAAAPPTDSSTPAIPAVVPEQTPTQVDPNEPQDQVLPKEEEVKEDDGKKQKKQKKSKEKTPPVEEPTEVTPDLPSQEVPKEEPKKEEPKQEEEDDGF